MKTIILLTLTTLLLSLNSSQSITSDRTIYGTVEDDGGSPLIGAQVIVEGTNRGTTTDFDGKYLLSVKHSDKYLLFSDTGYEPKRIRIGDSDTINVTLSSGVPLEEMVITGGPHKKRQWTESYNDMLIMAPTTAYQPEKRGQVWNTEDYDFINENKFFDPRSHTYSTFSIDTDGASYSNLRRMLRNGQIPPKDAVRIEEMVNYFNYDYAQPDGDVPFAIHTELASCPWNEDHKLLHIGLQGKEIPTDDLPPSNLVFLLDVSGSMDAPNKLPLVKQSFKMLTGQLRAQDKVAIVVYAGSSGIVLPSTSGSDSERILNALEQLHAGGGTAGNEGIRLAYTVAEKNFINGGNNRVILATDGDFNVGVSSDAELVRIIEEKRESGVFLSVLGYGMGNYKDNKMQKLANHGNGNHSYIDDISEARKVFVNEFGGTLFAIAKDVKVQVEFDPSEVAGYRLIGYENRILADEDFRDDKKDAGELGSGHTVTALYEIIPNGIESDFLKDVATSRYQKDKDKYTKASGSGEFAHIKFRYKEPDGDTSKEIDEIVTTGTVDWKDTDDNFRWSAAVAAYGMILRESEFRQKADVGLVLKLAHGAVGGDNFGYRQEFIRLVNGMEPITDLEVNNK